MVVIIVKPTPGFWCARHCAKHFVCQLIQSTKHISKMALSISQVRGLRHTDVKELTKGHTWLASGKIRKQTQTAWLQSESFNCCAPLYPPIP